MSDSVHVPMNARTGLHNILASTIKMMLPINTKGRISYIEDRTLVVSELSVISTKCPLWHNYVVEKTTYQSNQETWTELCALASEGVTMTCTNLGYCQRITGFY
jgi:hypothetical protein